MIQSAFSQWCKDVTSHFYSEMKNISTAVGFTSASFLVISYLILTCSRSQFRDAAVWVLYSLIGDLCHLTGAFLSNQTSIQCIMAMIMTSLDMVHFISAALPLCWWYYSSTGRRMRMLRRRRRQNVFVVCLLFGIGGYVYADIRVCHVRAVVFGSPTHRKLLNVLDQTELLGYVLGILSFDFSILLLSCYRIRYRRCFVGMQDSDKESLLGGFHRVSSALSHKEKDSRKHISFWKNSSSKMPEIKLCRNVQPIRKVCFEEGYDHSVRLSREPAYEGICQGGQGGRALLFRQYYRFVLPQL